jgi:anti-sigma B factor antagonist
MSGDFGLPPTFEVSEESLSEHAHLIMVRGELDLATASEFSRPLFAAIDSGKTTVLVDLCEVVFIGSNGLATLLNGLRRLTRKGGRLAIATANPTVLRMFEITRTDTTFAIFPTRALALAGLGLGPEGRGATGNGHGNGNGKRPG